MPCMELLPAAAVRLASNAVAGDAAALLPGVPAAAAAPGACGAAKKAGELADAADPTAAVCSDGDDVIEAL